LDNFRANRVAQQYDLKQDFELDAKKSGVLHNCRRICTGAEYKIKRRSKRRQKIKAAA
jgi:hypothetical protein